MRRTLLTLLTVACLLLLAPGAVTPAAAALYPGGIVEASYSKVWGTAGNVYTLTARLAVEVDDTGTQGRFRLHLACSSTSGETGSTGPHVCTYSFGAGDDAFWYQNDTRYGRDLETKTGTDEYWLGSWHNLSAGVAYRVKAEEFRVDFSGGPAGVYHTLDSKTWTKPPRRPNGLSDLNAVFGSRCSAAANDARAFFPWGGGSSSGGYIYFHTKIAGVVANVRNRNDLDNRDGAYNSSVYGYACRQIEGSTNWSTHSWGVAIDINSVRNPLGATSWDGVGSNGHDYGTYLPGLFTQSLIGNFHWGLNFSGRKDPMHFQYVTGY